MKKINIKEDVRIFLKEFKGRSITAKELLHVMNVNEGNLADALNDLRKENCEVLSWFYIEKEYYLNGKKLEGSFNHLNKKAVSLPLKFHNRYYMNPSTAGNIFLNELIHGEKVFKGQVDESDIGGLYSSAYTIHGEFGKRIHDFSNQPLEILLSIVPEEFMIINNKNGVTVGIPSRDIKSTKPTFIEAFCECIKFLSMKETFIIAKLFDSLADDEADDEEYFHPYDYSPVFYTVKEAESWCENNTELKKTRVKIEKLS